MRRRSKFGNIKTVVDGIKFDSRKEAARWQELVLLEKAGEISKLERQIRYRLEIDGKLICAYICDFRYVEADGTERIEDVKGRLTAVYRLKKKMMKACHGIEIKET